MATVPDAPRTFNALVPWANARAATPMADMLTVQRMLRGDGLDCGKKAETWAHPDAVRLFGHNLNPMDLHGRRCTGWGPHNIQGVNAFLEGDDLPTLIVADFLPENVVLVIPRDKNGKARPGMAIRMAV